MPLTPVSADAVAVSSITRAGSVATVTTAVAHGYVSNARVTIAGATETDYNGTFTVTVVTTTIFTYTVSGTPASPATGTITATLDSWPEPIALADAKAQCLIDTDITELDDWLTTFAIPAARARCEIATWRQLLTRTWDLLLPGFPRAHVIELPLAPLQTVVSVTYYDASDSQQTLAVSEYQVVAPAGERCARGWIELKATKSWPSTYDRLDAVRVRFTAGYGTTAAAVPTLLRQAMLLDIGALNEHREELIADRGLSTLLPLPRGAFSIYRSFKSRARLGVVV